MNRTHHSFFWLALTGPTLLLTLLLVTGRAREVYAGADVPRVPAQKVAQATITSTNETPGTNEISGTGATTVTTAGSVTTYTLPFGWLGATTVPAGELAATAPPLE